MQPSAPSGRAHWRCVLEVRHNGRCRLHGGLSTGAKTTDGLKKILGANLKHGKYTKDKLEAQRHAAEVGRRVLAELKRIEQYLTTLSF